MVRLKDDLRQIRLELSHDKFKEIEKRMVDIEVKYHLSKNIAQEIIE